MYATRSVDDCVQLQTCDFVLHQQLATLQLHDLEIVDRRMGSSLTDFRFQCPVPSFQFRKMGVFKLKPEGLNIEDLEFELIDFGLEEIGEDAEGASDRKDLYSLARANCQLEEESAFLLSSD